MASLARPYDVDRVHVEPVRRVRCNPQLYRIRHSARLPQVDLKWRVRGGRVPGVLGGVAFIASVAMLDEGSTGCEVKAGLPFRESSLPPADR